MSKNQERKAYEDKWHKDNREKMRGYSKKHYAKHKDELRLKHAEHYSMNREQYAIRLRKNHLLKKYGISLEQYDSFIRKQSNMCAICKVQFDDNQKACVDHCHSTGEVRGLLCRRCNVRLEPIEDKKFLEDAKKYLAKAMR